MIKIYLDTCVWGRPFDDQGQDRIRDEAIAFFEIAWHVDIGEIDILGSDALLAEVEDIYSDSKRDIVRALIVKAISSYVPLDKEVLRIAKNMAETCGCCGKDALQVASAKLGGTKYFITTDDELLQKAECLRRKFDIVVINPIDFVSDVYG